MILSVVKRQRQKSFCIDFHKLVFSIDYNIIIIAFRLIHSQTLPCTLSKIGQLLPTYLLPVASGDIQHV
jgi:hypothetical protein